MHCSCPMNSARGAGKKKRKKDGRRRRVSQKCNPNMALFYFFPFGYLLGTNYHVAMSSYSLAHSWKKKV